MREHLAPGLAADGTFSSSLALAQSPSAWEANQLLASKRLWRGVMSAVGLAMIVWIIAITTQEPSNIYASAAYALAICAPLIVFAMRGHMGGEYFEIPTPSVLVFVVWQLGLGPSMVAFGSTAGLALPFSGKAEFIGRVIYCAWFWFFTIGVGKPAARSQPDEITSQKVNRVALVAFLVIWGLSAAMSYSFGYLTYYRAPSVLLPTGSFAIGATFLYQSLTPILPSVGLLVWDGSNGSRSTRIQTTILMALCVLMVFINGSRTCMLQATLLVLLVSRNRIKRLINTKIIAIGLTVVLVGVPMLMYYRVQLQREGVDYLETPPDAAISSFKSNGNDRSTISRASRLTVENLRGRLAYASQYFTVVQHVQDVGSSLVGSMGFGFIKIIPTAVLHNKNKLADELDFEVILSKTGLFPPVDLGPSPIMQFIFEFGLIIGSVGGLLYGLSCRLLDRKASASTSCLSSWFLFAATFNIMSAFESTVGTMVTSLREPLFMFAILLLLERLFATSSLDTRSA